MKVEIRGRLMADSLREWVGKIKSLNISAAGREVDSSINHFPGVIMEMGLQQASSVGGVRMCFIQRTAQTTSTSNTLHENTSQKFILVIHRTFIQREKNKAK